MKLRYCDMKTWAKALNIASINQGVWMIPGAHFNSFPSITPVEASSTKLRRLQVLSPGSFQLSGT